MRKYIGSSNIPLSKINNSRLIIVFTDNLFGTNLLIGNFVGSLINHKIADKMPPSPLAIYI